MFSIRAPPVTALITLCKPVTMADSWSNKQEEAPAGTPPPEPRLAVGHRARGRVLSGGVVADAGLGEGFRQAAGRQLAAHHDPGRVPQPAPAAGGATLSGRRYRD